MTSPTVTAVSDERLRELRTFPELTTSEVTISLIDECLRARSALADVGESAYNWGTPPFPNYPAETVASMAEIGEAFMDALPKDYSWCQSPAEIIADLQNKLHDAQQPRPAAEANCETCGNHKFVIVGCPDCSPAAKAVCPCTCHPEDNPPRPCPRKYALSECLAAVSPAADNYNPLCPCAACDGITRAMSPAAHTAQLTPTQPLIDALEEAISLMGQEARDVWRSAQRNKDEPRDFEQYMDTYHGWVRDTELVAKHVDELRRLAEQGSGAKDAKEGGT